MKIGVRGLRCLFAAKEDTRQPQQVSCGPWVTRERNKISFTSDKTLGWEWENWQMLKGFVVMMRVNYNKEHCRMYVKNPGGYTETSADVSVVGIADVIVHCNRCQCRTKEGWSPDASPSDIVLYKLLRN